MHSYSKNISWVVNQSRGFRKNLGDKYRYTEYEMDTKRIDVAKFSAVASEILENIKRLKPSMVYVTDDNALRLVGRYVDASIPVVFSGINAHLWEDYPWLHETTNITGVLERPLIKRNIMETMNAFGIQASKILMLMDTSVTSQHFFKLELQSRDNFFVKGAEVDVFRAKAFSAWKEKVMASKQDNYDFLLIVGAFALKNDDGSSISAVNVAKWISVHSPTTAFTSHLQQIGQGLLVGGLQLNGEIMGADAGKIAVSILVDKRSPHDILPQTQTAGELIFSQSEMRRRHLTITEKYKNSVKLLD